MKKIRYGIIGVGNQGGFYARYLTGGMAMMGAVPTNAELGALCGHLPPSAPCAR